LDIYDIKGLPSIMILNKNSLLAWKGRHACYEYIQFENFMHHTLSEVMDTRCSVMNCEICIYDINIEKDLHGF
jgi:hypothetical protein